MSQRDCVRLSPCQDYDVDRIEEILRDQMNDAGVLDKIKPGMRIALKMNLVAAMKPDTAVTTHPAVAEALCRIIKDQGAEAVMGDSPGGPYSASFLKGFYSTCGLNSIAERTGASVNMDFETEGVTFTDGVIAKTMTVTAWLLKADMIINCCKLKTHGMMGMSAAVKNMFGSIPGTMKPEYHFRFPEQKDFANMLVDIQEFWKPHMLYHVVDGITGMEGNGPTAGTPRHIGVLMSSADPYALDLVGGRLIGLEGDDVATMTAAYERGLGEHLADTVEIRIGKEKGQATADTLRPYMIDDYELLGTTVNLQFGDDSVGGRLRSKLFGSMFASKPQVNKRECIGCAKCYQICPAHAIEMKDKVPVIDRSKCIKCFCCQEFCPKGAMKVHRSTIARILT